MAFSQVKFIKMRLGRTGLGNLYTNFLPTLGWAAGHPLPHCPPDDTSVFRVFIAKHIDTLVTPVEYYTR